MAHSSPFTEDQIRILILAQGLIITPEIAKTITTIEQANKLSRKQLTQWLQWNDSNGVYSDDTRESEGLPAMTKDEALAEFEHVYANSPTMNPNHPEHELYLQLH